MMITMLKFPLIIENYFLESSSDKLNFKARLKNGKIVAQDTPSNLVKDINAKNSYFGDNFKFN